MERIVALGASNLTRGFHAVVTTARLVWGPEVEVFAALGHGRSYGVPSRFLVRTLPGILRCGLWHELERQPRKVTRGLVTDVGNDILYGFSAARILEWIEETLGRLCRLTRDIVLTDLPLASVRRLSNQKFLLLRTVLVPSCRLSLSQVLDRAEQVNGGLALLAARYGAGFFRLNPAWYGFDPIHIRPGLWRSAWRQILGVRPEAQGDQGSMIEAARLYVMRPERRWLFSREQITPQSGVALKRGGRVWLY
ncbi:MAG: hypothetical protein NNA20_00370 [Nitrospira sp.]|nr:hypothetical protein [Nitrospira sp.]MCP9441022.1 hypothetical protein [Nitrospira sp.]